MGDRQRKCILTCVFEPWVYALLFMLVGVLPSVSSQQISRQLFLNSGKHCSHDDIKTDGFIVDKNTVYNVLDNANQASLPFQDCQMVFQSLDPDGRICVKKRKLNFVTCDMRLQFYDSWTDVDQSGPDKTLDCDNHLSSVEWCTSGRNLTLKMAKNGKNPSLKDVSIDVLVYDLRSVHRTASLDYTPSCSSAFLMDSSHVVVTNIDPNSQVRKQLFPKCNLIFEYKGQDKNRTMCMVFEANQKVNRGCSKLNYTLTVFSFFHSRSEGEEDKELSTVRSCENPLPHRWCSNSTKISLELHSSTVPRTEDAVVFYAMVLDHDGDLDTLPSLPTEPQALIHQDSVNVEALAIGLSVAACFFLLVICAVIAWRVQGRLLQCGNNWKREKTRYMDASGNSVSQRTECYESPEV